MSNYPELPNLENQIRIFGRAAWQEGHGLAETSTVECARKLLISAIADQMRAYCDTDRAMRAEWQPIGTMPAGDEVLAVVGGRVTVVLKSMGEYFDQLGMPDQFDRLPKCTPRLWKPMPLHPEA